MAKACFAVGAVTRRVTRFVFSLFSAVMLPENLLIPAIAATFCCISSPESSSEKVDATVFAVEISTTEEYVEDFAITTKVAEPLYCGL